MDDARAAAHLQELLGARGPCELRQTHISNVLLGERDVYKLKKPVDLGFLDFTTLAKRKAACEAEVVLNRRLASHVYLGVRPVTRGGEVVDYAVHMRRLPDARRGDVMLRAGGLHRRQVDATAALVARFHAQSAGDPELTRFGHPDAIAGNVSDNFAATRALVASFVQTKEAAEIEAWQRGFLALERDRFCERLAAGCVRDGHGDLRLEHLYFVSVDEAGAIVRADAPTVIDCIEFSDRFRYADVCCDLAFLSMDLAVNGRVDLAERLLYRYARDANDYDLYPLVDFYESYRAYVRAKIASIMYADPSLSSERRTHAAAEARRYLLLALSAKRPLLRQPGVVVMSGGIASGKSTLADALAYELGGAVVEADRTRKHLLAVRPTDPVHDAAFSGGYTEGMTETTYGELVRRAEQVVASGRSVILDASFRASWMREQARELARRHGVPFLLVECRVSDDIAKARLRERQKEASVSDGRLEIFDAFKVRWEEVVGFDDEHFVLDTDTSTETSLKQLRDRLHPWPRGLTA